VVGAEGLDLPSAGPKLHDWQASCHRKVSLRIATGNSHPDPGVGCSTPANHTNKNIPDYAGTFLLVGAEGLEPPTLSV
jgi:hypothetical protein